MADLSDVKIGDEVILSTGWSSTIAKIEAITPKGFIKVKGKLYHRNGYERISDTWNVANIRLATEEEKERIYNSNFIAVVLSKCHRLEELSYEEAKAINSILDSEM